MKICFLAHNLKENNGGGVLSLRLVEGIKNKLRCEAVCLTSENSGKSFEKPILYNNKLRLFYNFFRIRKIIKGCDIVHALDIYPYAMIGAIASLGLKKKFIITAVGSGALVYLYRPFYSRLIERVYRRADKVIAISNYTKREILNKIPDIKIEVINPGTDLSDKAQSSPREDYKDLKPYILSVGALRARKGYYNSIQYFSKISKVFPNLKYVIVGKSYNDKYSQKLKDLISANGLDGKILIFDNINTREELYSFYKNAELFCLLSKKIGYDVEGFGIVFLEAASFGLPVIGSKNCGAEDAISDGANGYLVDFNNKDNFADAVVKILKDKELKKKMSESSLVFVKNFSWDKKITEYIRIYRELGR
ncbi:MAG: hypothetical protein COU46_03690 [Candidatus Niyogibacteria bacterium CG10_big_fil_rev_8_21_14_0_10_42_19]|uniref:Glycosyltransferase family 1 protein n=1 Tax=Candidatus Niyogibacteria bacterium CG10_big_fil_rev_8_21_14_0_10_42_19 TaxID=1974725 RepID=A0A2H0TER9_9BACT|nr:MAG: hypothetical protein COU46_03690 [Candidatus Niyogibacteria bacterium CG10_big_fil_rev_8_21_14_0_10_42_19]